MSQKLEEIFMLNLMKTSQIQSLKDGKIIENLTKKLILEKW
jgi:hypothetical protein